LSATPGSITLTLPLTAGNDGHMHPNRIFAALREVLAPDAITIADYLGSVMMLGGECITCNFSAYPNISRWMTNMKALKHWSKVNEVFYKYMVEPNRDKPFIAL